MPGPDPALASGPAHVHTCATGSPRGQDVRRGPGLVRGPRPGTLLSSVRIPTLIIQGTPTRSSPLDEAISNYASLRARGIPSKMMWFCGGHGACLTGGGEAGDKGRRRSTSAPSTWRRPARLVQALPRPRHGRSPPGRFEWIADDAQVALGPEPPGAPRRAAGGRTGRGALKPSRPRRRRAAAARVAPASANRCRSACRPAPRASSLGGRVLRLSYSARARRPGPRVRADRRHPPQARRRQPGHADPGEAGRQRGTPSAGRWTRSRPAPARAGATRCRSSPARGCGRPSAPPARCTCRARGWCCRRRGSGGGPASPLSRRRTGAP